MRTTTQEEIRKKIRKKIESKKEDINTWMKRYHIDYEMKKEIMKNINKILLEEDKDAEVENLFNVLPGYMKKHLKRLLCLKTLSQVELLQLMDDSVLIMMCDCLKPVTYAVDHIIFPKEHPIDRMLLIIEGTVWTYGTSGEETATKELGKGDVYGEELLMWASPYKAGIDNLPTSNENVKCHTQVEGFALSAKDLLKVVSKHEQRWKLNLDP
ncbi:cyclic nucleotide-gated ion channel 1-like [Prunus avium]|uniref:Cyclic nucleotide-gated ion channel 1-like n=1 Tax=Prunus avium TaxID=42229 RepID=A0A6P5SRB6_PRUAV|nr:cyclic nucleotide-gated ion channel 1-like [Prunus avium]